MQLRNIHFADFDSEPAPSAPTPPDVTQPRPVETILKSRKVSVSPHEEYALRNGEARPISDSLAAIICSRKGRAKISLEGITVDRKDIGGKRLYHHPDSRLCNDQSSRERKIYYVLNSMKPEVIHLLTDQGVYIESLPEKFQPAVLNNEEQKKEYDDQRRQVARVARHLQELHRDDTKEAMAAIMSNNNEMRRIVNVLGTDTPSPSNAPAPSELGDRILAGDRSIRENTVTFDRQTKLPNPTETTAASVLAKRAKIEIESPY
jgi:hypothetical protein